jgi:hypothetical protein
LNSEWSGSHCLAKSASRLGLTSFWELGTLSFLGFCLLHFVCVMIHEAGIGRIAMVFGALDIIVCSIARILNGH